jgi:hypothetical protein
MRRVRVTKERLSCEKERKAIGDRERGMGQLESMVKKKGEKSREQPAAPTLTPAEEGEPKIQLRGKPGGRGHRLQA